MSEILLYYRRPDPTTWVYLSSFLTIGLFFVFHRFWSIRNLDIFLLILLAPGLLMVYEGRRRQLSESEIIQSEISAPNLIEEGLDSSQQELQPSQTNQDSARSGRQKPASAELNTPVSSVEVSSVENRLGDRPKDSVDGRVSNRSTISRVQAGLAESDTVSQTSFIEMTKAVGGSLVGFVSEAIDGKPVPVPSQSTTQLAQASQQASNETSVTLGQNAGIENETLGGESSEDNTEEFLLEDAGEDGISTDSGNPEQLTSSIDDAETFLSRLLRGPEDPRELQRWGFVYLFIVEALLLLRLLLDPLMVRRPLLDPNLTTGGLYFIGISLFIFMMANVVTSSPRVQAQQGPELGPGYAMMNLLPAIPTRPISDQPGGVIPPRVSELTPQQLHLAKIAKTLAILAQFSIVVGIVLIGSRHFSNIRAGVGCSLLYLLLPYTAQMTGRVDHVLPAALLLWAVLCYRRPMVAGIFLGLAGGLVYYPLFLLPLWGSFYWRRGARKFGAGVAAMLLLLMIALSFDSSASLSDHLYRMFGLLKPNRDPQEFRGLWALGWNPIWRLPVIVGFAILAAFFSIWPARKNLGTLMSSSAALMVAAQFWHGYGGGLYIAWFMPLLLLVIFRPNLQDRIAAKVVVGAHPTNTLGETETESA